MKQKITDVFNDLAVCDSSIVMLITRQWQHYNKNDNDVNDDNTDDDNVNVNDKDNDNDNDNDNDDNNDDDETVTSFHSWNKCTHDSLCDVLHAVWIDSWIRWLIHLKTNAIDFREICCLEEPGWLQKSSLFPFEYSDIPETSLQVHRYPRWTWQNVLILPLLIDAF